MKTHLTRSLRVNVAALVMAGVPALAVCAGNPCNPHIVGTFVTPGAEGGIVVSGNLAYIASGTAGLLIVDVSDPTSSTLLGLVDTPGHATDVALSGNLVYVADGPGDLQVVDVSDYSALSLFFVDVVREFGGLDVLVNNAGIAGPTGKVAADCWHSVCGAGRVVGVVRIATPAIHAWATFLEQS